MEEGESYYGDTMEIFDQVLNAQEFIVRRLPQELQNPPIGVICGSGLGGLSNVLLEAPRCEIEYGDIPFFPRSTGV